jgi:hypothetical protein
MYRAEEGPGGERERSALAAARDCRARARALGGRLAGLAKAGERASTAPAKTA